MQSYDFEAIKTVKAFKNMLLLTGKNQPETTGKTGIYR